MALPPLRPTCLAFAFAVAAAAVAARAEEPGAPASELGEELVIRGPARPPQAEAALAPGAAVTVVDAARFAGEVKGAAELLALSPGVAVTDHGGIGRAATVSIRGSSADQVKVLLDGIPLNPSAGGGVDLSSIPPQWISRIEVVRGTEGVHHGSGALGGIVNVVTAPPRAGTWSTAATAGSFGTWQGSAQAGGGGERWALLGAIAASGSSGRFPYDDPRAPGTTSERERNASTLAGALVKGFVLGAGGRLDLTAQLSGERRELPGTPYDPTPDDWQEDGRGVLSLRFRRPGPAGVLLSALGSARLDRLTVRLEDLGGSVVHQRGIVATGALAAEWQGGAGAASAELEAGAERLAGDGFGDHVRPVIAATVAGEVSALGGRARVGPGVRLERAGEDTGVSAKAGGSVALLGPLSLRASAGRTYRVPSFAELYLQQGVVAPNPALRPEVGLGGDAALVADGRLGSASVGAFATLYRDLVVYDSVSFRRLAPRNEGKSVARGLEAELVAAPLRRAAGLSGGLAYTFMDTATLRGREAVLGKELARRPRHRLYARARVGGDAAEAHAEAQWVSRQWLDAANSVRIPAAFTVGAGASIRLSRPAALRLHLEIRNLLDDRSLQDGFGNPLPGRTVLATLRAGGPNPGER